MYNKRKYNKINDKKVLHKIKKQWVVLSLSMLAMIGAGGAIATQTHASTVNTPQVQQEKQVAPQQTPNAGKKSTPAKPVINLSAQAQKAPVSTTNNGNKGKQLSLSDDASNAVHQTPSIDDIISAVDSNTWNSQYGSKYTDLLSNLNYSNVQVFDSPTAYSNYLYGNSNVPQTNQYQDALTNVKQDLNGFVAYPKVQALQNLINTTTTNPSTYSPIFSNPLFNGFETTFNNNDANTYNGILNDFSNLETDRNNNSAQASDLQNALNGLNSLSNNAKEAVTKFYGISLSDISNEIDRLNSGYTPQEMVYQPIELKYYDVASKQDTNADNESTSVSRAPVSTTILNENDFNNANPFTMVPNSMDRSYISGLFKPSLIANDKLQVPNGYEWDGIKGPDYNGFSSNTSLNGKVIKQGVYFVPPQQQLHFNLITKSEAVSPMVITAYVRKIHNININDTPNIDQLKQNSNVSNPLYPGIYGMYEREKGLNVLYIGGDFSQYTPDLTSSSDTNMLIPENIRNNVNIIRLEDAKDLNDCSYMFADLPNLLAVYQDGNFDGNVGLFAPGNISYMFANDPNLLMIKNNNLSSSWHFYSNCHADGVFQNDNNLCDISGLKNWDTSNFVTINHMFDGDSSLTDYSPISHWDVGGINQMNKTFANADSSNHHGFTDQSLEDLIPWDLRGVKAAEGLFYRDLWLDDISSLINKPIGTGSNYPDLVDAFKMTKYGLNQCGTGSTVFLSKFDWQKLNPTDVLSSSNSLRNASWIPKMYRTEDGHYTLIPDSDAVYFGDPFKDFNGVYYKNDGYLILTNNIYTLSTTPKNSENNDVNANNYKTYHKNAATIALPSKQILYQELENNGIYPSDIKKINLIDSNYTINVNGSLKCYFANLPNLQSIQGGESISADTNASSIDTEGLFYNDPKLNSIIGFFGNDQAVLGDSQATQSTNTIKSLINKGNSTANMFNGDCSLFNNNNAKANIDAISSIPMDSITKASYMFNNTGLNDSNIVTNWNLSNLQNAEGMFAGCNLTNLNGFDKLNQIPTKLQSASYMFADNPHLTDLSGISGNNIDINPITNVSHMFDGDTDLTDVSSIENGNNNWRFNQQPNVSNMFSNTNVGYDTPKVENNYGQFILGAMPKQDNDHINFNGDASKNTIVRGDDGTNSSVSAPEGYHFINGSNGQFTFNHGTHTFNVAPDTMVVPVEFKDTTNGSFLDFNPNAKGLFTVNKRGTINFNNDVLSELQNEGYQLSQSNNYSFIVKPCEVRSDGTLYPGSEPTINVDPIPATSTIEYEYNGHDVTDNGSTKSVTGDKSVDNTTFNLSGLALPMGYQLSADNPATDAYSNNHAVVNVTPIQATDNIVYKNGYQVVSGDSNSTNSVTGNEFVTPNSFNTNSLVLPNGYELAGNGTDNIYDGNTVEVQVVPKPTTTTIHYEYNGHPLTDITKQGSYNGSFNTDSLSLPDGYNLADGNQTISDNNANVAVNLVPQQKTDTINFVDSQGVVSTSYTSGDSSATGLDSSHFTVGNTPNGLPSGYQVENPSQVINYDGGNHTIMIKPIVQPTPSHKSSNTPNNKPSVNPTPSHKSGNTPSNKPNVTPTPNHTSGNKPNNTPSVNPTPSHTSDNTPSNKPSVNPTPSHKSGTKPNNKPSVNPTPSNKSGNTPNTNPSVKPTPSHKSDNTPNNTPSINPTPSHTSDNTPNNTPSVNPTPSVVPTPNPSGNVPSVNPQPASPTNSNAPVSPVMPSTNTSSSANNVPATSTTTYVSPSVSPESTSSEPVAESSNFGTPSENKVATKYAKVAKVILLHTNRNFTKRNAVSVVKPGIIFKVEKSVKARNGARRYEVEYNKKNYFITASKRSVNVYYKTTKHANNSVNNYIHYRYAKVIKALQLHTTAKFTKRNGIKVVRPGAEFRINRIVKNRGLVRYEIRYQGHNYFITANHNYTVNAYLQKYNFRKHGYKAVRVIKPLNEYRKLSFTKRNSIRHFTRGSVLPIKKVITIAKGEVTRLQLTNGRYVTANKNFVEVIK